MDLHPLRAKVVAEAREWIGTPFHDKARVKQAGVDCGQFLVAVYEACGCMPAIEVPYYPIDFALHNGREWYAELLLEHCDEVTDEELRPADIALYKFGRVYSHGAIIADWPWIIHAYVDDGVVLSDGTQGKVGLQDVRFFRPRAFEGR